MHSLSPTSALIKLSNFNRKPKLQSQFYHSPQIHRSAGQINLSTINYRSFCITAQRQELQASSKTETKKQYVKNLLPVIDFTKEELKPGTSCWVSTGQEVSNALETYGCFEAVYNKEIPVELQNSLHTALDQLFGLPVEAKRRVPGDIPYFGYGANERARFPLYDGIGFFNAANLEGTQKITNTLWPEGNDFFCETVLSYSKKAAELEKKIMQMVFENYGVGHYETHKDEIVYMFRMNKYRLPNSMDDGNVGVGTHTDKTLLSILGQHQTGGLLVRTKNRQWTSIEPSTSSLVVMAGEALTAWSNGRIYAPFHKVMMEGDKERYSVGLFSFHKGILEVPKELIDEKHPLKFKPFNNMDFMRYYYSELGRNKFFTLKAYCGV